MSTQDEKKGTAEDRDANYRALVRDVVLGTVAVIFLSLAVPAWIIRAEYRKTYSAPVKLPPVSVAEVLRERTSETVIITPRAPDILELAEQLVQREAERREAARREAARREAETRAAEIREPVKREAERRAAEIREAERHEAEGGAAETREAERRAAETRATAPSPITRFTNLLRRAATRPPEADSPVVNTPQVDSQQSP